LPFKGEITLDNSRRFAGQYLCLSLIVFLSGCATYYKEASAVVIYVNQDILGISELETKAFKHYGAVTGKNFTTNDALLEALKNDVNPAYQRFLDLLKKIKPQSAEVKQLHAIFIRGAETISSGFKTKMFGLQKQDHNLVRLADEEIKKGVKETFKWRTQLNALYKKHGIVNTTN
jgi:hypothetical protein